MAEECYPNNGASKGKSMVKNMETGIVEPARMDPRYPRPSQRSGGV